MLEWTASRAVTTEAPQQAYSQRGRIPGDHNPSVIDSDALVATEVQYFLPRLIIADQTVIISRFDLLPCTWGRFGCRLVGS
jgi:hypothetical protein